MLLPSHRELGAALIMAVALGATSQLTVVAQDASGESGELTTVRREAIALAWVDGLWAFYAGEGDLTDLTTPDGHEALRSHDWRYRAVESGGQLYRERPVLLEVGTDWGVPGFEDGERVSEWLELVIDVAPLAETVDRATDKVIEVSDGVQRRVMGVMIRREPGADRWLVDDVGATQDPRFKFGLVEVAAPQPCPGLGSKPDPFMARPWCTADGDGRKMTPGTMARSELEMTKGPRGSCWAGTHRVALGWPPGDPQGRFGAGGGVYVRDPKGVIRDRFLQGPAFKRDARLPGDAISTGITNGSSTIWTSHKVGDRAIFMQVGDRFERWPLTDYGCA